MLYANLYMDKIELAPYLTPADCVGAAPDKLSLSRGLKEGRLTLNDCRGLTPAKRYALSLALQAAEILPPVQSLELPRPITPTLYEINEPGRNAPLLVTGNSEFTLTVLTGLFALTVSPLYLLLIDTRGDTADMAMIYRSFTAQRLDQGLEENHLAARLAHRRLIIPGVLGPMREELEQYTGWDIKVGPICAAELPLFLGEDFQPPPVVS